MCGKIYKWKEICDVRREWRMRRDLYKLSDI